MEESMKKIINQSIIFLVIVTLIVIPFGSSALAQEFFESTDPEGGEMIYDTVVLRPVGLIATAVGSVFFILSLPFSALANNVDDASEKLVKDPYRYTFKRPLGEF
jgi:hypothetical protein